MRNRLWSLVLGAGLLPAGVSFPALASEISDKFESALARACEAQESVEMCSCYAGKITSQYDDRQLVAILKLLKDKEANDMFLVIHSQVGMNCKNSTAEN